MEALQNFLAYRCNARFCPTPCHVALGTATFLRWVRSMRLMNLPDRIRTSSTIHFETFSVHNDALVECARACFIIPRHRAVRSAADLFETSQLTLWIPSRSVSTTSSPCRDLLPPHRAVIHAHPTRIRTVRLAFPPSLWPRRRRPLLRREETLHEGRKERSHASSSIVFFPSKSRCSIRRTKLFML